MDKKQRVADWLEGNSKGPYKLQLNPTNRCNLSCRFCWLRDFEDIDYEQEVTNSRLLELVTEASEIGIQELEITGGGEPSMRPDLLRDLILKSKRKGLSGSLITNGTRLSNQLLEAIVTSGWDTVIVSLDGAQADTHDRLRGVKGSFSSTVEDLTRLSRLKTDKTSLCVHFVLCRENYQELEAMVELIDDIGADNFFVEPMVELTENYQPAKQLKIGEKDIDRAFTRVKKARSLATALDIGHNLDDLSKDLITRTNESDKMIKEEQTESGDFPPCFKPWYNLVMRPGGEVGPCCLFDESEASPNVKESSLKDIWFGKRFQQLRQTMKSGELANYCNKCNPSQIVDNREIKRYLSQQNR